MKRYHTRLFLGGLFILSFLWGLDLYLAPDVSDQIAGVVVDARGRPIVRAIVSIQSTNIKIYTDRQGRFSFDRDMNPTLRNITAWKSGYYCWGTPSKIGFRNRITLTEMPKADNEQYEWIASLIQNPLGQITGHKGLKPCETCHPQIAAEWKQNTHAQSARNPVFFAFFNGDNSDSKIGFKKDFPHSNGNCAACHIPGAAVHAPFGTDPNTVKGVDSEGVFCDFCHKIRDVDIDGNGGRPGVLSIQLHRPPRDRHIFYGPFNDIFAVDESSYNPIYSESRFCAPCHYGKFWDNSIYSEFQEWQESDYARDGVSCQACHMPPTGDMPVFAPKRLGAAQRDPMKVPSHLQLGVRHPGFMRRSISMQVDAEFDGDKLRVSVNVRNTGAGHHYPTGSPFRNMIMVVRAANAKGAPLPLIEGDTVPIWGGEGDPGFGNFAGLPGKGFAKIFKDTPPYPGPNSVRQFKYAFPSPYWRPAVLFSDNRIPANKSDASIYVFNASDFGKECTVVVQLIFRRAFKNQLDELGLDIPDLELARKKIIIKPKRGAANEQTD